MPSPVPNEKRAELLAKIKEMTAGGALLPDALKKAGVSQSSYYAWKNATKAAKVKTRSTRKRTQPTLINIPVSTGSEDERITIISGPADKVRAIVETMYGRNS